MDNEDVLNLANETEIITSVNDTPEDTNRPDIKLINNDEQFNILNLRINEFEEEKQYKKMIKSVKSIVRKSIEYHSWVDFIKYTLHMNECAFSHETMDQTVLDLHHHPISIENMIQAIINEKIHNGIKFCAFDIAADLMYYHYSNHVGYVLMLTSLHNKFHSHHGNFVIGMNRVSGNWKEFYKKFRPYMSDDAIDTIEGYMVHKYSENYYTIKSDPEAYE